MDESLTNFSAGAAMRRHVAVHQAIRALYDLHDDLLGTPQLATDCEQNMQWQASYEPFGATTSVSGEIVQNLRFPGQYFDVESGWNHNAFRDYMPELSRYIEPDQLGRLGSGNNLYAYVNDNPTNLIDPLGLCPAMNIAPRGVANRFRCAAANANSLANMLGISQSNVIGQSLLGNDVSTVTNIILGPEQGTALGEALISNPTPINAIYQTASAIGASETGGIRLVQTASQDVWGNPQFYAEGVAIAETSGAKALSKAFGIFSAAKLAFDVGAYAYAYAGCSAGH